ncbi:MAG TPA: DUF4245 domain-containing protein [Streptosporangiaceae bacterium]
MLRAIATCVLLSAAALVVVPPEHASSPVQVSYRGDLDTMTRTASYQVFAPAGLPRSWIPVNSGVAVGGANGAGTVTWRLSFATPDGTVAALEETNAPAAPFIRRMTNGGTAQPPVTINGRTWTPSLTPARDQRSLYLTTAGGVTLVVTGNAALAQLRTLAAALRPAR